MTIHVPLKDLRAVMFEHGCGYDEIIEYRELAKEVLRKMGRTRFRRDAIAQVQQRAEREADFAARGGQR